MESANDGALLIVTGRKWLEKSIQSKSIQSYPFNQFTDTTLCTDCGAHGTVYKAKVKTTSINVIYRFLNLSDYDSEDAMLQDFVDEIEFYHRVDKHSNIVSFLGISKGIIDSLERYLMVFEYADGGSLRSFLSNTAVELDWPTKCKLGINIIDGLDHLHKLDILHKNLSSTNIMICAGVAKLTDFSLSDSILQQTRKNNGGVYAYLDPRCLKDEFTKADEKSDIFSFGVVLWEISSRKLPCGGLQNSSEIKKYRQNGKRDSLYPATPKEYVKLYSQCWDNDAEKRPCTEQISTELKTVIKHICAPASAQYNLGVQYQNGVGVEKNYRKAVEFYKKAVEQGHVDAQCNLAICYQYGIGTEKCYEKAVKLYQKAIDQGHVYAQSCLGICYMNGIGVEKNYQKAVNLFQKAAKQSVAEAEYNLALCYHNGIGVKKDQKNAFEFYQKAANQGHAHAQYGLGQCYKNKIGVKKDFQKAIELFEKAAEQGHAKAQYTLGQCYEFGIGVRENYKTAVELYKKAAAQRLASAQYSLGQCYELGVGVEKDHKKTVELYQKAADQGNSNAQYSLGLCFKNGTGVEKDPQKASELFRKAAEQGHSNAQYSLGWCC